MSRYPRYQDYVIKDDKFIGEFDLMYRECNDPWEQSTRESNSTFKQLLLFLCQQRNFKKILEVGCGHGFFTDKIQRLGTHVTGMDVSETAIKKAKTLHADCTFIVGDVLDFALYEEIDPDCIIFADTAWYILDKLLPFLQFYKTWAARQPVQSRYLLNFMSFYPADTQQYGREYFTTPEEALAFFNLDYEEHGVLTSKELNGVTRLYFLGKPFPER